MANKIKGLMVAFEEDIDAENVETVKMAILALRGVAAVTGSAADHTDWMAREHVKAALRDRIAQLYRSI